MKFFQGSLATINRLILITKTPRTEIRKNEYFVKGLLHYEKNCNVFGGGGLEIQW